MTFLCGERAQAAGPELVAGPGAEPACFAPWDARTAFFRYPAKAGPYRIALANGLIDNVWRPQMVRAAKAYAAQPAVAAKLAAFEVVSTGAGVGPQIAAIERFVEDGYDAVLIDAEATQGFEAVIERAAAAGVVLIVFDNTIASNQVINIAVDQTELGALWAGWLVENLPGGGRVLHVRGVEGASGDIDRAAGVHRAFAASGRTWDVVEVYGDWNDAASGRAAAEAFAAQGPFDGIVSGSGDLGVLQAMTAEGQHWVPYGGETQNGFRAACAAHGAAGLRCRSTGTNPGEGAVALKAAIAALEGAILPQSIRLPHPAVVDWPDFKAGVNFFPDLPETLYVDSSFPDCAVEIAPEEITRQSAE